VPEFAENRLRCIARERAQRIVERQAGLDAADDDVDRIGKLIEELRFAPFLQVGQRPARQAEAGGKCEQRRRDQAGIDRYPPRTRWRRTRR
jgi:hypothetical protein